MPKRKHFDPDEIEFLNWKIKKLEQKLQCTRGSSSVPSSRRREASSSEEEDIPMEDPHDGSEALDSEEVPPEVTEENPSLYLIEISGTDLNNTGATGTDNHTAAVISEPYPVPEPVTEIEVVTENNPEESTANEAVDKELLEILGVDPSTTVEYGAEIHKELASRLQHLARAGLTKEARKELNEKYLVPANCTDIGAPLLNAEIKAAVTEVVTKRDKGIESRQKQLASAISGLASILTKELEAKDKDSTRLKQLMDVCRILCDIQHAESVTRRNFTIYSLKKELKEHLVNTKIDKYLFGENLAETLKSAKAVTKSGTELKTKPPPKPKPSGYSNNNLNWKSPAPARKQQGGNRGREAAPPPPAPGPPARFNRSTTHASSSKTSQHPSKQTRRR